MMKKFCAFLSVCLVALSVCGAAIAREADAPGSKLVTVQLGGGPGFGTVVSGNVAIARLGGAHLYAGLQAGADLRKGFSASRTSLSLSPRVQLGFNAGQRLELHVGGFAGIAVQRISDDAFSTSSLPFSYGGFGGARLALTPSLGLVVEGCYSPHLPYGTAGLAFRF